MSELESNIRNYQGIEYNINDDKFQGLSKRQIKKLLKTEKWNENKQERKEALREKTRQKRIEKRQKIRQGEIEKPPTKKKLVYASELVNIDLIIDCGFNELMTEKELFSFVKQLSYAYGKNRIAPKSMKMTLTSFDNVLKTALNTRLPTWAQWSNINIQPNSYLDHFDKDKLIYLTADSDHIIDKLEEDKCYVVGGIVDKNRYKNLCQDKASKQEIQTARLPIGDYLQLSSRKVLTVNQVCEIMSKWLELNDWQKAFMEVIPERKLKDVILK